MVQVTVDTSQVREYISALQGVPAGLAGRSVAIMSRGAMNIKNQLRSEMQASRHFKRGAGGINYDILTEGSTIIAEVGPDKGTVSDIANIAYFGGRHGGGGTVPDPRGALEAEAPNLDEHVAALIEAIFP